MKWGDGDERTSDHGVISHSQHPTDPNAATNDTVLRCTSCGNQWAMFMLITDHPHNLDVCCPVCGRRTVKDVTPRELDPDGEICQDDYEWATRTGKYKND